MVKAVLFDLDDTLLANDMAIFLPAYLDRLARYSAQRFEPERVIEAVRRGTHAMISSQDPESSNQQVFWALFEQQLAVPRRLLEPFFSQFYREEFAQLQTLTAPIPGASQVVEWFRAKGCKVVLATNPVFPLSAIEQRIAWANLKPSMFDLVTSYENMHATKPSILYYQEILRLMRCDPCDALMVGNDWLNDIEPAARLGLSTFHVVAGGAYDERERRGTLERWYEALATVGLAPHLADPRSS